MSKPMPGIAVTSLLLEARIAVGPGVSVICGHASELVASLQAAIERGALGIISFGVAGGLVPDLGPGDWVIGSGVRTGDERYPADRRWSRRLLEAIPGSVYAEVAGADAPIAYASDRDLPPAAVIELRHDGTPDLLAISGSVMRQPNQIPALMRTAIDAWTARKALRLGLRLLGVGLSCPYLHEPASAPAGADVFAATQVHSVGS